MLCIPFIIETTYTPPGDENVHQPAADVVIVQRNNLRPVRGRKRITARICYPAHGETTYTPSGDENLLFLCFFDFYALKQLTPRQGTKTTGVFNSRFHAGNNLHPVRGRKLI